MCLPSVFMALVIRKTEVGRHWGGLVAFKAEYPDCGEDEQIVSLASMSSSEILGVLQPSGNDETFSRKSDHQRVGQGQSFL